MDDDAVRSPELTWQGCRRCRRREDCPYIRAADRGGARRRRSAQARLLDAEADRLLEAVSRADSMDALLRADEAVERTLARVLQEDLGGLDAACTP